MQLLPRATQPNMTSAERAHLTYWTLGATALAPSQDGDRRDVAPAPVAIPQRLRRLPGAVLLTAGYYADKAPVLGDFLRRPH